MGLPQLIVVHVGRGPETTLDKARYMSAMDKEKCHVCLLRFKYINESTIPKQKKTDSSDKTSQLKRQ